MNKQQKLRRKEKIKSDKSTYKTIKQPPIGRSIHASSPLPTNKWIKWVLVGVIVLITFITFSATLKNDFTNWWDDYLYVLENQALAKPIIEAIKYFFEQHYYVGNYIPVTMITYALEYHLFGVNPELYHLVNVLIHLLNVMMVFWFIYLLSGKKIEVAAIVSFFFGIHPMHVESVAWVSELKDVLYTFFFIVGLITYYKYIQSPKSKVHYSLTFILFIISVLSKPAAVIFPIVLLLLDFYTKRRFDKYVCLEKLPFFIASFIFGIITIKAQQVQLINESFTILQRLMFASYSMLNYIVKLVLPINLAALYPYPQFIEGRLPYIFYITPFIALLLFYILYLTFRYSRLILFGFLFFLVNIILVLQVISVGNAIMADRYTYIPYIGLFFIIAMGFSSLYNSKLADKQISRLTCIIVIIILAITSSYLTYARCEIWKNSETLWTDALNKFPDNPIALNNKATVLSEKGQYKEAIKLFTHDIQLKPDYTGGAYINLAVCYKAIHDYDNALKNLDIGLKYAPDNYKALNTKGCILFEEHQYKDAIKLYNKAINFNPQFVDAYTNIASCYFMVKDYDNAIFYWKRSLEFNPNNMGTYKMLGLGYQNKGDKNSADAYFAKAKELEREMH